MWNLLDFLRRLFPSECRVCDLVSGLITRTDLPPP